MFVFVSKLISIFIYPLGLACILLIIALFSKHKSRWAKGTILAALILLWFGSTDWVSASLVRALEWQYFPPEILPEADVIIVLGGGTNPAQFPRRMVEINGAGDRVLFAGWLYHQGVAPRLLLSGGTIDWLEARGSTPAEEMASILKLLGIPDEAIVLETESQNTFENAKNSTKILHQEGFDRVVLVTSAQHMPRSVALFEGRGVEVIPAPTDYNVTQSSWERLWEPNFTVQVYNALPKASNLSGTTTAIKELLGIMVYKLPGWK